MQQKLMRKMAVFTSVFTIFTFSIVLAFVMNKDIFVNAQVSTSGKSAYSDSKATASDQTIQNELNSQEMVSSDTLTYNAIKIKSNNMTKQEVVLNLGENSKTSLVIDKNVDIDQVYTEHNVIITLKGISLSSDQLSVETDADTDLESADSTYDGKNTLVKLTFSKIKQVETDTGKNCLKLTCNNPRDLYDKIVVIDVGHGGTDIGNKSIYEGEIYCEKDIALAVAKALYNRKEVQTEMVGTGGLTGTKESVGFFFTRLTDTEISDEKRVNMAKELSADLLIGIQTSYAEDAALNGTQVLYNGQYFIPGFGSVELADILERDTVTKICSKAIGLVASNDEDYLLRNATMPVAVLQIGYQSNQEELIKMLNPDYCELVADGIYSTVLDSFESAGTIQN